MEQEQKIRIKAVPASYLILLKAGKILLMRRQGTDYYNGWYCVPAGHVEAGELPIECLIRETKEEIGLVLGKDQIKLVHTMYRAKHDETGDRLDLFFAATAWSGQPSICEPHKCDDIQWFPLDQLPKNLMHHVRDAINFMADKHSYSEFGLERIVKNS